MGESAKHSYLVNSIYEYVITKVPDDEGVLVLVDLPTSKDKPPRNRDGYCPDVEYYHHGLLIIGDAKTSADLESQHSRMQIDSYILECHEFEGNSLLVLGVPFADSMRACSVISSAQRRLNTQVPYTVINEAGVFAER